jgi:uncharacterized protein YbaP (TraB family)
MGSYERVIELLKSEIKYVEEILDEIDSEDSFITIGSYLSGLNKTLTYAEDMKKIQDSFEEKFNAQRREEWLNETANKESN